MDHHDPDFPCLSSTQLLLFTVCCSQPQEVHYCLLILGTFKIQLQLLLVFVYSHSDLADERIVASGHNCSEVRFIRIFLTFNMNSEILVEQINIRNVQKNLRLEKECLLLKV